MTLDDAFPIADADVRRYRERGYVKLRRVLPAALIERYHGEITRKVQEAASDRPVHSGAVLGRVVSRTVLVRTSRDAVNQVRQPIRWYHHSRCTPGSLSRR